MKNKKLPRKTMDSLLFKSYKLNLQTNIKKIQRENNISVEKNREAILEILKRETGSNESNYFFYLSMAKCKTDTPSLYYRILYNSRLRSSLLKKNNLPAPLDEKKLDHLNMQIRKLEEEILPPSERELLNLFEKHRVPSHFWPLLKNFIIYGEFGDEFNIPNLVSFEHRNIWFGWDEESAQEYIEIRVYGNTTKKEILDNWPLISKRQKMLPEYKSSKSKLRSPIYDKIADKVSKGDDPEDIIDDRVFTKNGTKVKNYSKKLKKIKTQERRRKKHFNL